MSDTRDRSDSDLNLVLGMLALQMGFLDRESLISGMHAWLLDRKNSLGQILLNQGHLAKDQLKVLDALLVEHIKAHDNDPQRSLQAISKGDELLATLSIAATPEALEASLAHAEQTTEWRQRALPDGSDGTRYRKVRVHAQGGLGTVFVAEDAELHRQVALKEIKRQRDDRPSNRSRFVAEAEITGRLEHPGIVPVYGLGVYPDGRPYYAMRLIHGESLARTIDLFHEQDRSAWDVGERSLALRRLLRCLVDACNAVAYAHCRGVLHRDIKPDNIMVGKFGETLVVDWGLAKAGLSSDRIPSDEIEATIEPPLWPLSGSDDYLTMQGSVIGTPPFMSPEQASGRLAELGPATDVYGLGATLYMILTGKKPIEGHNEVEILGKARRGEFPPPREVKVSTPAPLEAICLKAMAKNPEDRYVTALALAAEVEHWLADEPVSAYRESWTGRASRWARRRQTTIVAAAVFLVSAVAALAVTTILVWNEQQRTAEQRNLALAEQIRTAEQKEAALQNLRMARDLSYSGFELIERAEATLAANAQLNVARKDFLVAASEAFRRFLQQQPDDDFLRQRTARVFHFAANVMRKNNDVKLARPLYQNSIAEYETLAKAKPADFALQVALANEIRDYGKLLSNEGKLSEAVNQIQTSLAIVRRLEAKQPKNLSISRNLAAALLNLASVRYELGDFSECLSAASQAAERYRAFTLLEAARTSPYDSLFLAASLNLVAMANRENGKLALALEAHAEATTILAMLGQKPNRSVVPADLTVFNSACLLEQSRSLSSMEEHKVAAEKPLLTALEGFEKLVKEFPKDLSYPEFAGTAYQLLGKMQMSDLPESAEKSLAKSEQILVAVVREPLQMPTAAGELARTYLLQSRLAGERGQASKRDELRIKAQEALEKALQKCPEIAGDRRSLEEIRKK